MNKKIIFKTKAYILGLFLSLCCVLSAFAQEGPIKLSWDTQVGCEEFGNDAVIREILLSEITPSECLLICAGMPVKYKLTGAGLGTGFTTTWSVTGGTISAQTNTTCNVTWGAVGIAYLTFTITLASGIIVNNSICVNKKPKPTAYFTLFPFTPSTEIRGEDLYACFGQTLNLTNYSVSGNSQVIYNSLWDFGDSTPTSTETNPNHIYQNPGDYKISLTITNSCGCTSEVSRIIHIGQRGFDIRTPSLVCEGQTDDYYTDLEGCTSTTTWSVIGGTIIPNLTDSKHAAILWNNPPASGFGTVTFDPSSCNVPCPLTTSIKVPIIARNGTIIGDNTICTGEQASYSLPQWPSTDFEWKVVYNGQINPSTVQIVTSDMRNEVFIKGLSTTATVPGFPGGQITLYCYYTNTFLHCGGTATYNINIANTVDIAGASTACLNNSNTYTTIGGTLVNWSLKKSTGQTIAIANSTGTNSITIPFDSTTFTAGNYILSISGNDYCTTPITINVKAPPATPVISTITSPTEPLLSQFNNVCPSATYTYRISNPVVGIEYVWAVTDGNFIGSNIGTEVNINFNASTTQSISVFAKGVTPSCNSTTVTQTIMMVTLTEATAIINNAASGPNLVCSSSTATYTTPYTGADSYLWSIQPSSLGSVSSGQGTNQVVVQWNNATQASGSIANLRLTINKCSLALTVVQKPVTILNTPSFTLNSNINTVCSGGQVQFSLATPNAFLTPSAQVTWTVVNDLGEIISLGSTAAGVFNITTIGKILNPGLSNTIRTITASVILPASSGCSGTYLATKAITVTPGPGVNLTFTGGNTFCTTASPPVPITTVLTATSTTTGVTYAWFRNGNLIAGIPNTTSTLSAATTSANGAGNYTVVVTKNGCSTTSNGVSISSYCSDELNCGSPGNIATLTQTYVCSSVSVNSPILTFIGNTSVTPTLQNITVVGPTNIPNPTLSSTANSSTYSFNVTTAGDYDAKYKVVIPNGSGGFCKIIKNIVVNVPYIPKFLVQVSCSGLQYNIQLVDNSSILNTVTNRNYKYYISSNGGTSYNLLSTTPYTATGFNTTLNSGSYIIKLVLEGTLSGMAQTPCERRETLTLPVLNPVQNIQASIGGVNLIPTSNNVNVACYNSVVQFSVTNPVAGETYLWNFADPVDNIPATNSQPSPPRVFSNFGPHSVTVTIKNSLGCTRTLTLQVTVPPPCFKGNVISQPSLAKICKGSLITISYKKDDLELGIDNCVTTDGTTTFTLMNQQAVIATNTTGTFTTTVAGFYWLKLSKAGLVPGSVCVYETPGRISTQFVIPPTLTLSSSGTICFGEIAAFGINSSANASGGSLSYVLDGTASVALPNPTTQLNLANLAEGNHTLVVTATLDGCTTVATASIAVVPVATPVTIAAPVYVCAPTFKVTLTASAYGTGTYLWSNGMSGPTITVYQGGSYEVTFINEGGCSSSAQTSVFTPPIEYLWSFPSGNYQSCSNDFRRILGPNEYFYQYQWLKNNVVSESGNDLVKPYHENPTTNMTSGTYQLKLSSGPNTCVASSLPMQLNVTPAVCNECNIWPSGTIQWLANSNNTLFCSYIMTIYLAAPYPNLTYLTGMPQGSNAIMGPLSLVGNQLSFTIFPLSPFAGGTIPIQFSGNLTTGNPLTKCLTLYDLLLLPFICNGLPAYKQINSSKEHVEERFLIAPNPAKEVVEISFTTQTKPTISIYDLTGRFISDYNATTTSGTWQLPLNTMSAGIYLVVLKENGQVVQQKKLVVE